jgi:hypothetical protein
MANLPIPLLNCCKNADCFDRKNPKGPVRGGIAPSRSPGAGIFRIPARNLAQYRNLRL